MSKSVVSVPEIASSLFRDFVYRSAVGFHCLLDHGGCAIVTCCQAIDGLVWEITSSGGDLQSDVGELESLAQLEPFRMRGTHLR